MHPTSMENMRLAKTKIPDLGNNITIVDVGGRGTKQTKDQELSWMLVLSGMQYGGDPDDKDAFLSLLVSNSSVYGKIDGMNQSTALGVAAFLGENDSWYKANVSQCKKFKEKIFYDLPFYNKFRKPFYLQ